MSSNAASNSNFDAIVGGFVSDMGSEVVLDDDDDWCCVSGTDSANDMSSGGAKICDEIEAEVTSPLRSIVSCWPSNKGDSKLYGCDCVGRLDGDSRTRRLPSSSSTSAMNGIGSAVTSVRFGLVDVITQRPRLRVNAVRGK